MRRLLHKLFRRHRFEQYELELTQGPDPHDVRVYYIGYNCRCGEPGFPVKK